MSQPQTAAERAAATRRSFGAGGASLILYVLPIPLFIKAIVELLATRYTGFAASLALFVLFVFGASLARRGIVKTAEFKSQRVALAGGVPYKVMGGIVIAGATFLSGWLAAKIPLPTALAASLGALLGFFLTFGFDARGEKGVDGSSGMSAAEVAEALQEARGKLGAIEEAAKKLGGAAAFELRQKLRGIVQSANKVLGLIEDDPRDLRRARKFLNVYLDGAKNVTENYAATSAKAPTPDLESRFRGLLDDMQKTFDEQRQKLLENDTLDLDAQIEVLKTRLTREGL